MFCPNCGNELRAGSKFCGACGAKLSDVTKEENAVPTPQAEAETTAPAAAAVAVGQEENAQQPKKGLNKKFIMIGAVAVAVIAVIIAAILIVGSLFGGSSDSVYVYLSDGNYGLLPDLKEDKTIQLASGKSEIAYDYQYYYLVKFSSDGKYVYYYTKVDGENDTGTLNRAEWAKLKEDSEKNEAYIQVIDKNVQLGFQFFEDGTLAYLNGKGALCYYDGEESVSIAKEVSQFMVDESTNRILYVVGEFGEARKLYGVSTQDLDDTVKLASNVSYLLYSLDFDHIFYMKENDDYEDDLYVVGFEKESEKLGENVQILTNSEGVVCFAADEGKTVSLYDFVIDDMVAADAGITEPDLEDYGTPWYGYSYLDSYSDPEDYEEIYTSCTQTNYFFYDSLEGEADFYTQYYTENAELLQNFVDKYRALENEEGYFVVTDEIKAELIALAEMYGYGYENEWLELCYAKEQYGTDYDYEAYYDDYDRYAEAEERIWLREDLQNSENDYPVHTVYCYDHGDLTTICENMLDYSGYSGAVMYNTTDLITEMPKLEEVYYYWDIENLFYMDYEAENFLLTSSGAVYQMSEDAAAAVAQAAEDDYFELTVGDGAVYMEESDGALSVALVNDGVVSDFDIITEDGVVCLFDENTLYYADDIYEEDSAVYGDLYSCVNGESTRMVRDILLYNEDEYSFGDACMRLYEDGVILAYTEYGSDGNELTMVSADGETARVDDDVTHFIRIDKETVLYISDGDLYWFDGEEGTRLQKDVDYIWGPSAMAYTEIVY